MSYSRSEWEYKYLLIFCISTQFAPLLLYSVQIILSSCSLKLLPSSYVCLSILNFLEHSYASNYLEDLVTSK